MEETKEDGTCGKGGCCGIRCGCCICKAIKGLVLLLIGGAVGFSIARCGSRRMCSTPTAAPMQSESSPTPAATAAPKKAK